MKRIVGGAIILISMMAFLASFVALLELIKEVSISHFEPYMAGYIIGYLLVQILIIALAVYLFKKGMKLLKIV